MSSRIGVLGGSFSPPTHAHLSLAVCALSQLQLEKLFLVPCSVPGFDKSEELIDDYHRFNMTQLAVFNRPELSVLDFELFKGRKVYAHETFEFLKKEHKDSQVFFIGGSDTVSSISKWRNPQSIMSIVSFAIARRGDVSFDDARLKLLDAGVDKTAIIELEYPKNEMSSTIVRDRIRNGEMCNFMLPDSVIDYIEFHKLYKEA
ncbi:MAG TPA: nicotinate (nicotinamide) nucleotide adenylyltransferase [Caldisericia bacterium]|nr:nicotinate (nicotinamide) nucleotide adenylyltransferase [Caldisericia bacterium]HPF48097.1 nicotinate (nicotinamide) nucleotide adenylyltransferase [Caldisericia bacterium]HPI83966.1 nicotinate (nicotinamide) nucleotide adenylyltransferase [Caldisericia bacterium]HPQ92550.1 nicotinate (nicotinamide) nucleotide adenylyltransferase [Caldisericia bacterium]HRV74352.1 nicotinate (nicotinamide) nucleotide adenylyltransferase [Caldisericia bacterium]